MKKKRGQVTVFIIVGIVILFSAAMLFYTRVARERALLEEEPVIAEVPSELLPVKEYVESCIEQVGKEGLSALGQHGGYIDINDPNTGVTFVSGFGPTSSDYVEFVPGSDDRIPYWYYLKSPNADFSTCEYSSKQPPLRKGESTLVGGTEASIERQLERYIDNELAGCLRNFAPLAEQGFVVTPTKPVSKVSVAQNDVRFLVAYPLTVERGGAVTEVKEFYVKVPLELKRIYELASEMVQYEQNYSEIEQRMRELIAAFSDIDSTKLPPTTGLRFELAPTDIWLTNQVKDNLELMFQAWVRAMQVYGSKNFDLRLVDPNRPYADIVQQIYNNFVWAIEGYDDVEVRFDYLSWWPIYFDLNDKGGVFEPTSLTGFLPIIGMQDYSAFYDVSLPVYVEIKQPANAEFPEGYVFRFFMEGNIRNNEAFDCGKPLLFQPGYGTESLACNINQRNSGDITIRTVEPETHEPISDVVVSVKLGDRHCSIGQTDENGMLVTKFPVGYGAVVSLRKLGYLSQAFIDNFELDLSREYTIELYKSVELDVSVEKVVMRRVPGPEEHTPDYEPTGATAALAENEYAIITLFRSGDPLEGEHTGIVEYRPGQTATLELVPGTYDIGIQLFVDEEVYIPEEKRCPQQICPEDSLTWGWDLVDSIFGTDIVPDRDDTCRDDCVHVFTYTMPEVTIPAPRISGGAKYDWGISSGDILRDNVVFKALSFPAPQEVEEMQQMGMVEDMSREYKTYIIPQFSD